MRRSAIVASVGVLGCSLFAGSACSLSTRGESPIDSTSASVVVAPRWDETIAPVSRAILGHNTVWSRGGLGVWNESAGAPFDDVVAKVKQLSPGVLRFPGGTRAMRYHFDRAIGSKEDRAPQCDPFRGTTDATSWGPDEFLRFAESVGAKVTLVAPWVDGTPEEAAAFVAYANADPSSTVAIGTDVNGKEWGTAGDWGKKRAANGHPASYRVAFVEIGNEPYTDLRAGPSTSCGRPSPFKQDERWVNGVAIPTTAKDYASQVAIAGAKIHAVDSSIQVGAAAYSSFDGESDATKELGDVDRRQATNDPWNARLVTDARGAFDLFVLHPYDFGASDARLLLAERMRRVMHDLRSLDATKGFAVTEYGFLIGGGTMMNVVATADVVRVAVEERATIALRHVLIEDDPTEPFAESAEILGAAHAEQPSFQAMRLMAETLQNKAVSTSPPNADLTVLATCDASMETLGVVIVDRRVDGGGDPATPIDLSLPSGAFDATITTLGGASLASEGSDVALGASTTWGASGSLHLTLPAHAVAFVKLTLR
jgi:hypothetical protein